MDDGSIQNKGLHLNTYSFSDEDVELLFKTLKVKFLLKCSIHKHKAGNRIYIWEESMKSLLRGAAEPRSRGAAEPRSRGAAER